MVSRSDLALGLKTGKKKKKAIKSYQVWRLIVLERACPVKYRHADPGGVSYAKENLT
jgi:hypothetical protein